MLSEKMQEALNEHIGNELFASHYYLAMQAFFEWTNLKGFSHWMRMQSDEERMHALKLFDYIHQRNGRAILWKVEQPTGNWTKALDVFEDAYKHEKMVSSQINELVELAWNEKDHATYNFLQWFVSEQVEEEDSANEWVDKLRLAGDSSSALLILDREVAARAPAGGGAR